ncbi:hypothetical protein ACJJTC_003734 [Scirpophaga incertulas]
MELILFSVFDARIIINEHALFLLYLGAISNYICSTNTAAISNDIRVVQAEIIFRVELAVPFAKGVVHSDLNTEGVAAYGFDLAPGLQDAIVGVVEATIVRTSRRWSTRPSTIECVTGHLRRASSVTDINRDNRIGPRPTPRRPQRQHIPGQPRPRPRSSCPLWTRQHLRSHCLPGAAAKGLLSHSSSPFR